MSAPRGASVDKGQRFLLERAERWLSRGLVALCFASISGAASAAEGDDIAIEAEYIAMENGLWRGVGAVRLRLGAVSLKGEEAHWDSSAARLEVLQGDYNGPDGLRLSFERLVWQGERFSFLGPTWLDPGTGLRAKGASLELLPSGLLEGSEFQLGCDCEGPSPWLVRARSVRWDEEGVLRAQGGSRRAVWGQLFAFASRQDTPRAPLRPVNSRDRLWGRWLSPQDPSISYYGRVGRYHPEPGAAHGKEPASAGRATSGASRRRW